MAKQIAKSVILSTKQPNHMAKQIQSHAEGHPITYPITWRRNPITWRSKSNHMPKATQSHAEGHGGGLIKLACIRCDFSCWPKMFAVVYVYCEHSFVRCPQCNWFCTHLAFKTTCSTVLIDVAYFHGSDVAFTVVTRPWRFY